MAHRKVEIEFEAPSSVLRTEMREFIIEALECWGGQRHPDDHLFGSLKNVKVRFVNTAPEKLYGIGSAKPQVVRRGKKIQ